MFKNSIFASVSRALLALSLSFPAHSANYAGWLTQIGVNDKILSAASWGRGSLIGIVDTGVILDHKVFASGQVSSMLSMCSSVTFACTNGAYDDNGHGTGVASIAAANIGSPFNQLRVGGYVTNLGDVIGLASQANIASFKVLNQNGTGRSSDVANGIRAAADSGASVINLSISFGNTSDLIQAMNYAASKGATMVWAGGNDSAAFLNNANTFNLSQQAIDRLVFVGSVNAANNLSTFSNNAGSGSLVNLLSQKTAISQRWIVAPGENILTPYAVMSNGWTFYSGTSMAAPLVTASLSLLQTAWPILKNNGTADDVLFESARDLGAAGTDNKFGRGLVDLTKAFQPTGNLTVKSSSGTDVLLTSVTGKTISKGALGSLSKIKPILANYTSFDKYKRDFKVNLTGLLVTPRNRFSINPLPQNQRTNPNIVQYTDGTDVTMLEYMTPNDAEVAGMFDAQKSSLVEGMPMYALVNTKKGETIAAGRGYPSTFAYSRALFGTDDIAIMASDSDVSSLSSLTQGGVFFAYGNIIDDNNRYAFSFSQSPQLIGSNSTNQESYNFNAGFSQKLNKGAALGVNLSMLNEKDSFLSTSYGQGSFVNFGASNQTQGLSFSFSNKYNENTTLLFEAGISNTKGSSNSLGFITSVSDVKSSSYGLSLITRSVFNKEDSMNVSVKQPLRVISGNAQIQTVGVDEEGLPVYRRQRAGLAPEGREIKIKAAYNVPLLDSQLLALSAGYSFDRFNIAGENEVTANMVWSMKF